MSGYVVGVLVFNALVVLAMVPALRADRRER